MEDSGEHEVEEEEADERVDEERDEVTWDIEGVTDADVAEAAKRETGVVRGITAGISESEVVDEAEIDAAAGIDGEVSEDALV